MNFLENWFQSVFSTSGRVFPSKWVMQFLFSSAPRKFKNLGTDAFIASRLTKFFLVISRCMCNKGVRSRQEYIKMSSIANLWLWCKRIWDPGKSPYKYLMCTQCNPYIFKEAKTDRILNFYLDIAIQFE